MLEYFKDPAIQETLVVLGAMGAICYWIIKPPKEEQTKPSELELKAKDFDAKESYKSKAE